MQQKKNKRIYLDYASSTPIDSIVHKTLMVAMQETFGNPSALYLEGLQAEKVIEHARESIAKSFDVHSDEIIFTSGGTESDTLALSGVAQAVRVMPIWKKRTPHIIVSAIEHAAVLETAKMLATYGIGVTYLPVDGDGLIDISVLRKSITKDTVLVSIMYANNEIGTIEPIHAIAKEIRFARKKNKSTYPLFHTDAVQALNYLPIRIPALGVDLLTASSSKIYGPKGIGMLYVRRGVPITPLLRGGDQEFGLRPGTPSAPLIAAFAKAIEITSKMKETETMRLLTLRDWLMRELTATFPAVKINGSISKRLPNNLNITLPGFSSEHLVIELDAKGIAVSAKSACKSDDPELSHVLAAIGKRTEGEGSIRISLGRSTTKKDLMIFVAALKSIVAKYNTVRKKY